MMTGELDYESIFLQDENSPALLSIIILVVFIILVFIILSNLLVGLAVSDMYSIRQRSEVLRLTRHVELMTQVEALFRSRFMPKKLTTFFLKNISITDGLRKPSVSIFPNRTNGFIDSLFLLLSRWLPSRRFLIKVFEIFVSGFIAPEHEPSLPKELLVDTVNIALREHELDKRDRLLHLRAHQASAAGQHKYLPFQQQQPFTNQTTLTNKSNIIRTASVGQRNSWRWTFTSDTDVEDDTENALPVLQTQASVRASWLGAAPVRSVAPDPNAKLDELRVMVLGLQSTVENLMTIIHQQQRLEASPHTQRNTQATLTENTSNEVSV